MIVQIAYIPLSRVRNISPLKSGTGYYICAMSIYNLPGKALAGFREWRVLMRLAPPHGMNATCAMMCALIEANPALAHKEARCK